MGWEPYTLDELRQLDGEQVWLHDFYKEKGEWKDIQIVEFTEDWKIFIDEYSLLEKRRYEESWLAFPAPKGFTWSDLTKYQRAAIAHVRPCRDCVYFSDNLSQHGTKPENKVHWCDRYEIVLDGGCTCGTFRRYRKEDGE